MAMFKPKPMAKPVIAPKPVAAKPVIAPKPVAAKPVIAPILAPPTTQPVVGKKDAFYKSPEYKGFQKDSAGKPATMDMYKSPYFGSVGSGSVGRAQDDAYRKYKGIAAPTPNEMGNPVMPGIKPLPPGSPMPVAPKIFYGNKQPDMGGHSSFYNSLMGGGAAPSQPVMGNNINTKGFKNMSPATPQSSMKKGGAVGSASKRADGIAVKGKTKGRTY